MRIGGGEGHRLEERILGFIDATGRAGESEGDRFDALALEVFAWQFTHNAPYRRFCLSRGVDLAALPPGFSWQSVPAIPTDAFKVAALATFPVEQAVRTFRTSGTTQVRRGEHHFLTTALYDAAIVPWFRRYMLPDGVVLPILSLIPSPETAEDSSLSHMVGVLASRKDVCGGRIRYFLDRSGMDLEGLEAVLRDAAATGRPVMLLTTAVALAHLFDERPSLSVSLPPGSRVMQTGGTKGYHRVLEGEELIVWVHERLGIPPTHCVAEYGMTELSSQMYETVLWDEVVSVAGKGSGEGEVSSHSPRPRRFVGPPWLRCQVVDPVTETPMPPGEPGLIRFFDLANLHSVSAVQTGDVGLIDSRGLVLLGRAAAAEPRGCSLTAGELLEGGG